MTELLQPPTVSFKDGMLTLSFEALEKFPQAKYFENEEILIDQSSLLKFHSYLNLDNTSRHRFEFSKTTFTELKSNITFHNASEVRDLLLSRFHQHELGAFFFVKNFYPKNFILKSYQSEGIRWLQQGSFRLLADDMGLGKTAQSITAATELFRSSKIRKVMIVCPRSLMPNWVNELKIWAKPFKSFEVHSEASTKELWQGISNHGHFFIINYDQLKKLPLEVEGVIPDLIIADEAHKLRKSSSQIHKKLHRLSEKSSMFWALTGTPIEKNVDDLINIMKVVNPKSFTPEIKKLSPTSIKGFFRKDFLRRVKADVLAELGPPKEKKYFINLDSRQRAHYDATRKKMFTDLDKSKAIAYFGELRRICDVFEGGGSKIELAADLLEKIYGIGEKAVVFSFNLEPLHALKSFLEKNNPNIRTQVFEGSMSSEDRELAIKNFKTDATQTALLCSGKIASEGLNLTEANHVIFINEWWNPSSNMQAQDRVLRIGQTKQVSVYKIRSKNTVEESLDQILDTKVDINAEVIEKMVRGS